MVSLRTTRVKPRHWLQHLALLCFVVGASMFVFVSDGRPSLLDDCITNQQPRVTSPGESFQLATHDSLGFFRDVTDEDWKLRKTITNQAEHVESRVRGRGLMKTPAAWYQTHWNEDFSCFHEVAVGGMSDGHKYVCDPHRLQPDCLVYSIGSNGNFQFETGLQMVAPQCEIHIFDPDDYERSMKSQRGLKAQYHAWGLKASYPANETAVEENFGKRFQKKVSELTLKTIQETVRELGHEGRRIDIFKIDCEGCEWRTYRDWVFGSVDLRQILIEVHNSPLIIHDFFQDLHDQGYVVFHKEPNIQWGGGNCVEYSFLKLHKDFFQS